MRSANHLPIIGIAGAFGLFVVAAMNYPGGTMQSANSAGYSWAQNFISSLFAARALNGAVNPARYFAIPALLLLCVSLAFVFVRIAATATSPAHKKIILIGGIGAMVYAFLIATPMHDLMISVSLVFSLAALIATTHLLYTERRWVLSGWGVLCLVILLVNAGFFYGNVLYGALPVMQKANWAISVSWLLAVYYSRFTPFPVAAARAA